MCGIVGLFMREDACDRQVLDRMRDALVHRGPDDAGTFIAGPLGLGHRRLSIIDLSSGHQPMSTPDGRFTIVFNGEIYNYIELRREMEALGTRFLTKSDTEVILELHARYGDAATARLNGIFCYAIWDAHARRLLLARDRAGVKPLYYASSPRGFVFGSEIKALFKSDIVRPRIAQDRISEYLQFRHVAGPRTLFADVNLLLPGHVLEVTAGRELQPVRFWDPDCLPAPFSGSFEDAVDSLDRLLHKVVTRQMISDVPLGTFCSGGVDSSLITAVAAKIARKRINTYSVGFEETAFDESRFARLVARQCGTDHHELRVTEKDYTDALPGLVWHHDLPLNFANSVHIHALSKLARERVTVVLTGEGADELFGGYPRYAVPALVDAVARLPQALQSLIQVTLRHMPDGRLRRLGGSVGRGSFAARLQNCATIEPDALADFLREFEAPALEYRRARLKAIMDAGGDAGTTAARLDFVTYLQSILERQDKMSMATSIEARVPYLDNHVIDFARALPPEFRRRGRVGKRVLKHVALRHLPHLVVHRRKSGFGVPLGKWLAGNGPFADLMDDAVQFEGASGMFRPEALRGLVDAHRRGESDHSELLWPILNLSIWRRQYNA